MNEVRAVPKPSELTKNQTIKKCLFCDFSGLVYVRTKNCPKCNKKGSLIVDEDKKKEIKTRKCACGCGETVYHPRKYISGHNLKRRPKDAIVKNGRSYTKIKCSECGNDFLRRTDQINRHGNVNLCSKKCVSSYQSRTRKGKPIHKLRNGEYRKCLHCKEEFYVKKSLAKRGGKYCSNECKIERQKLLGIIPKGFISSADNSGKKNGMYKHGKRIGGHISKKKVREKVIERDGGNWCLFCGKPGPGLHLHRIVYGSQGGKYEVDNCVQLCPVHHELVHTSKRKWKPILEHYIETGELELPENLKSGVIR